MNKVFLLIIVGLIVTAAVIVSNPALAASLTFPIANPSNPFLGKPAQYAIKFITATAGTIKTIDIKFPSGTVFGSTVEVVDVAGIGLGTTTFTDSGGTAPTVTYTVINPVSIPLGTKIFLFIVKVQNTSIEGNTLLTVTTKNTSGGIIDGPTDHSFYLGTPPMYIDSTNLRVGIGTLTPTEKLEVNGNIKLTGTKKILGDGDICIGSGC